MENKETTEKVTSFEKGNNKKKKNNLKKRWPLIVVILLVILLGSYLIKAEIQIRNLAQEEKNVQKTNEQLTAEKEDLAEELENINSKEFIERVARRDLKLIKPNEILFILPEKGSKDTKEDSILSGNEDAEDQARIDVEAAEKEGSKDSNKDKEKDESKESEKDEDKDKDKESTDNKAEDGGNSNE